MSVVKAEEAKLLWCPMSRVAQAGNVDISTAYNRALTKEVVPSKVTLKSEDGEAEQHDVFLMKAVKSVSMAANCIGKQCAMWRWHDKANKGYIVMCKDSKAETEPERPAGLNPAFVFVPCDEDVDAHWIETEESWLRRRRGYCGLAGRPEVL